VLVVLAAIVAGGCGGGGALGAHGLAKQSEAVQSLAAEGALLAEDSAAGRSTRIFREQHASELSKAAAGIEGSLASARTTPGLQSELRRLRALATRVHAALAQLGAAPRGEQRALERRLETAARESGRIGEAIG